MPNSVYRTFNKNYGLHLLPSALKTYQLGYKVEWDWGKISVEPYSFISELNLDEQTEKEIKLALENTKAIEAELIPVEMDRDMLFKIGGYIPNLNMRIKSGLKLEKVVKMTYQNIKAKQIQGDLRERINKQLRSIQMSDPRFFKKKLAGDYVFESLFYAENIELIVENATEREMKVSLETWKIEGGLDGIVHSNNRIVLKGNATIPFAANFKKIKDFID